MVKADVFRFRLDPRLVHPAFLAHHLSATAPAFAAVSTTGSTRARVNLSRMAARPVGVPPTDEQRTIADFLDRETERIDALVAKKQRLIELLQEKRTALISNAVTKGLDPDVPMKDSGIEWLGGIPAAWEVRRLKQVTEFVTSGSRGWAEFYSDDGPVFIRITNLDRSSVDLDLSQLQHVSPPAGSEGERTRVKPGDVLVSITADIGTVGLVPEGIGEAYVNQHTALTRPRERVIAPRWLALCVHSAVGQRQFPMLLQGGTKVGLNLDDVRNLVVVLPPLAEQRRLIGFVGANSETLSELSTAAQTAIARLQEYRSALITAAVTGQIDVSARSARRQAAGACRSAAAYSS